MDEVHSSENFKKFLDLENKLNDFTNQKSKIKSEIDTQFTKISRPLGRYAYGSSLDKEQNAVLSTLVDDPFDALLSENSDTIIVILENIRKAISSGSISVKDTDKTLLQLTETEESLDGFIKKVSDYSNIFNSISIAFSAELLISSDNFESSSVIKRETPFKDCLGMNISAPYI